MDENLLNSARQAFHQAHRILITSHQRPDGDAIGSVLGLGLALQNDGKEVQMVLSDGVPSSFRHLTGSDQIEKNTEGDFDITVVLDCSDLERIGDVLGRGKTPTLNIDHHITNLNFAEINLVAPDAAATTEILWDCLPALDLTITQPIAEALLTGLITDTIGFRTTSVTSKTLRIAADLVDLGCDLPFLYQEALLNRPFNAARYWGAGLTSLKMENRLVWAELTRKARKSVGYPGRDDADLINILSTIKDADIAIIFIEQNNGTVKVSWRAQPGYNVAEIAERFGGGGHKAAAGAEIPGNLETVKADVLKATQKVLASNLIQN
jgi:phosphoesterase RecJ-like protein